MTKHADNTFTATMSFPKNTMLEFKICRSQNWSDVEKGIWKEVSKTDILKVIEGKNFVPLNLEIAVPRAEVKKYEVASGKVNFYDGDKLYTTLIVKVVNTKY